MYIQYRKVEDNKCLYIKSSSITKEDIQRFSSGEYDLEDTNLTEIEILKKYIFTDFLNNDVIIEDDKILSYPVYDKETNTIIRATREQRILLFEETDLLQDGEYVENEKIITIPVPKNLLKAIWDKNNHTWKEGATEEEIKNFYYSKINQYKAEILENGFNFNGHQQKCREKDLALLGNAISALDDMATFSQTQEERKVNWAFNDNDIVNMSETDLRKMRIAGTIFINTVYEVEAELKATEPNILLKKQDFINKVNELSDVKCYETVV